MVMTTMSGSVPFRIESKGRAPRSISPPIRSCVGINHVLRRPNLFRNNPSTGKTNAHTHTEGKHEFLCWKVTEWVGERACVCVSKSKGQGPNVLGIVLMVNLLFL